MNYLFNWNLTRKINIEKLNWGSWGPTKRWTNMKKTGPATPQAPLPQAPLVPIPMSRKNLNIPLVDFLINQKNTFCHYYHFLSHIGLTLKNVLCLLCNYSRSSTRAKTKVIWPRARSGAKQPFNWSREGD